MQHNFTISSFNTSTRHFKEAMAHMRDAVLVTLERMGFVQKVTKTQTLIHVEFENGHKEIFTNKHLALMADCNGGGNWDHVKRVVVREELL